MNIANALVQYTKLTKVGAKKLINKAKELYPEVSADKAQNKSDLLTEKENASMEINSRILDAYIQAEIASTELNEVKEAQEHHVKASSFFESTSEELKGATPDSLSKITDLTNIIEAYLFAPCGTEMTGAETILDMIGDIE